MLSPAKLAVISVTGIGIAGVGTAYALSPKITIQKKLKKDKKKLLTGDNETLWTIKLSTYKKIEKDTNTFKLPTEDWKNLKSWCEEKIKEEFSGKNKALYERIKQVCIVPTNKEKLNSESKELATSVEWKAKGNTYTDEGVYAIPSIKKRDTVAKELEDWCKVALENEFEDEEKNNYPLVLKWCTKDGN